MIKSRLLRKIFLIYASTLCLVVTLDVYFVASQTRRVITAQIKAELTTNARVLLLMPLGHIVGNTTHLAADLKARVTILSATGKVLADSEQDVRKMANHLYRPEIQEARLQGAGSTVRYSETLQREMMYVALPVQAGGQVIGYLRLAKPLQAVQNAISHAHWMIFRIATLILISFLLLALFIIPKLIAPLLKIIAYTEKVRQGKVSGSLFVASHDELGQLAANVNLLVQTYEDNIRSAREEREKLASVFAGMVEGIVILDRENRIELVNRRAQDILGAKYADVTGKTLLETFRNVALQDALNYCRETGQPLSREILLTGESRLILDVNFAPIENMPGENRKIIMVLHDVTPLRKLERVRADFVVNVTHEIKTPLTAIIGFVQTLQEGAIEEKATAARFLTIISEHALRLNRLVDDLLTLSSIELGEVKLHPAKIDPEHAVQQALSVIEAKARAKGLAIHQTWPDNPPPILADGDSIIQIMVNVLDNAVKFTPAGSIAITAAEEAGGYLMITIADTGVGIPRNEIPRLGERFYRVDKMRSRELGGTGLGLSIVKHLLQGQQGRMEVESKPDRGTTVKLFFPLFPK